jgi:L-ribulose-5-phosphate 3-epimerase UlaE
MKKNFFKLENFGLMQGRLVTSERKGMIQYFPKNTWKKELKIFKQNKIRFIEWVANYENLKSNPIFNKKKLKVIIKHCKENFVKIRAIDAQFFVKLPFFLGPVKEKKKKFRLLKKILINSQLINIKYFIIPALENATLDSFQKIECFIKQIKYLIKYLNKKNFILIEADLSPKILLKVVNKINSNRVGINYDTGNSAGKGFSFNMEKKYFKFVKNIHLKDKKYNGLSIRLGCGDYDFKNFFQFLRQIKYDGDFSFQAARSIENKNLEEYIINYNFIKNYV